MSITPEVTALRKAVGFPGMRILQFAFDGHSDNLYLPHNFEPHTVVYTGTHDNDTTPGWWQSLPEQDRHYVRRYLGVSGESIHWDLIRAASASVAAISIVPMQDVLGLDASARMNLPGTDGGFLGMALYMGSGRPVACRAPRRTGTYSWPHPAPSNRRPSRFGTLTTVFRRKAESS